jgi:hypothetical protein
MALLTVRALPLPTRENVTLVLITKVISDLAILFKGIMLKKF